MYATQAKSKADVLLWYKYLMYFLIFLKNLPFQPFLACIYVQDT